MFCGDEFQVCLIGAGRAGMIHARNFRRAVPGAGLIAVADPNAEAARAAASELGVDRVYASAEDAMADEAVHGVIVVAPTKYHRDIVCQAARAGKHILCEKPLAMNAAECGDMIKACAEAGVTLQVGFMRRYDESFLAAKERVDAGDIGDVVMVRSNTRGPSAPQPWMYDLTKSNGPLAEVNSHDIDTIRWFAGGEFASVYAIGGNYRSPDARAAHPDFYDNVILMGRVDNGCQAMLDGAQGVGYGYDACVEIIGTKGAATVGRKADTFVTVSSRGKGAVTPFISSWRKLFQDAYLAEDIHFVQCARTGEQPRAGGLDGKMTALVVEAGNRSIRTGEVVAL